MCEKSSGTGNLSVSTVVTESSGKSEGKVRRTHNVGFCAAQRTHKNRAPSLRRWPFMWWWGMAVLLALPAWPQGASHPHIEKAVNLPTCDATTEARLYALTEQDSRTDIDDTGGGNITSWARCQKTGSSTYAWEILVGTDMVLEDSLKAVDSPADEECLTYEATGGDFEWQSCGGSPWTDAGTVLHPTTTTDDVVVKASTAVGGAAFSVDGAADEVQGLFQGNVTQTSNIFVVEESDGSNSIVVNGDGDVVFGSNNAMEIMQGAPLDSIRITGSGTIGFGTDTPNGEFEIETSSGNVTTTNQCTSAGCDVFVRWRNDVAFWTWEVDGDESDRLELLTGNVSPTEPFIVEVSAPDDALFIASDGDIGLGTATPDAPLHAEEDSALTNTVQDLLRLTHTTSGTPANSIGLGIEFEQETSAGNEVIATIEATATDVGAGVEDGALVFKVMEAGAAAAEGARLTSAKDWEVSGHVEIRTDGANSHELEFENDTNEARIRYEGTDLVIEDKAGSSNGITATLDSSDGSTVLEIDSGGANNDSTLSFKDDGSTIFRAQYDSSQSELNLRGDNAAVVLKKAASTDSLVIDSTGVAILGSSASEALDVTGNITASGALTLGTALAVAEGGTGATSLTDGGLLLGSGTGAVTALGVATNGQIPIGDGTTDPQLATLTEGTQIDITNGAGSITVAWEPEIAHYYDSAGGTSIGTAFTDITLDTETREDSNYTHAADAAIVTVTAADDYKVSADCSFDSSSTTVNVTAALFNSLNVEYSGTRSYSYHHTNANDEGSITISNALLSLGASGTVKLRALADTASAVTTLADSCRLMLERM